jgi:hypothetical protein
MARRPSPTSLADVSLGRPQRVAEPAVASQPPSEPRANKWKRANVREGQRAISFWVSPEAFRQMAEIGFEDERTVQNCMEEALDLFFAAHGKQRIAARAA